MGRWSRPARRREGTAREAGGEQGECAVTESRSTQIWMESVPQIWGPGGHLLGVLVTAFSGEGGELGGG